MQAGTLCPPPAPTWVTIQAASEASQRLLPRPQRLLAPRQRRLPAHVSRQHPSKEAEALQLHRRAGARLQVGGAPARVPGAMRWEDGRVGAGKERWRQQLAEGQRMAQHALSHSEP